MSAGPAYQKIADWISAEAIAASLEPERLHPAIDRVLSTLTAEVRVLGFGEALHGGEEILLLRNLIFQHLVQAHGYTAVAVESSFPRGREVNEYILGHTGKSFATIQESGFSHGFGKLDANRELIEWMRTYNADHDHETKLYFYGFDAPTEMTHTESPRQLLQFVLGYLDSVNSASGETSTARTKRISDLLGEDAVWENPAAMMDSTKSIGLSPAATALRLEVEELITELQVRRPELAASTGPDIYLEALQHATLARQLLTYHAGLARESPNRIADLLGQRDAMMADLVLGIVARERRRAPQTGKVFAFAHNSHLKKGAAHWQLGPHALTWWPAGAHLATTLGNQYAVIGTGVGNSDENGIGTPEAGTLEAVLLSTVGALRFVPTAPAQRLPADQLGTLPVRTGSTRNYGYFPFTAESLTEYDYLALLDTVTYTRGGSPLP